MGTEEFNKKAYEQGGFCTAMEVKETPMAEEVGQKRNVKRDQDLSKQYISFAAQPWCVILQPPCFLPLGTVRTRSEGRLKQGLKGNFALTSSTPYKGRS